ncbi:MAG: NigD-like C-terminal domain-containing protein [Rikenellaceae bacterium]
MKKKFYLWMCLALIVPLATTGCNNDDDNSNSYISMATVERSSTNVFLLRLDDGSLVRPNNLTSSIESGKRILMTFQYGNEYVAGSAYNYDIHILNYNWVLTKDIIDLTAANEKEIGNDPFYSINAINTGGGYLNVFVSFLFDYVPHFINLANNTIDGTPSTASVVNLELRQNAYGNNGGLLAFGVVSFPLTKYINAATAGQEKITFNILVNLPNGEKTISVDYFLNKANESSVSPSDDMFKDNSKIK